MLTPKRIFLIHPCSTLIGEWFLIFKFKVLFRKLEYQIFPVNAFLNMAESYLDFEVDVPDGYIFDNHAAAKLFENCKLTINHAAVNNNTSDADFYMDQYTEKLLNYEAGTLATTGSIQGIWSTKNYDSATLISDADEIKRRELGTHHLTSGKRYHFIFPLNLILARSPRPLPKDVIINVSLSRAAAHKSLIALKLDSETGLDAGNFDSTKPLKLINPTFRAKFFESDYFDRKLTPQRINKIPYPFMEKSVRRETLTADQDNFKIRICDGKFIFSFI